jgi:hypothetical protein
MSERAQDFRSPAEVETARPRLDRSCAIPLSEFSGLVGHYYFKREEWVECQIEPKPNSVCHQEHGDGWVARRKDGAEGFIGGDCAQKYFGADRTFATEASRVRRELRVEELIQGINARLNDPAFRQRAEAVVTRHRQVRDQVGSAREVWPQSLLQRLLDMVKTGRKTVDVEFRYVERDKEGKESSTWQAVTIGSIVGAEGLDVLHIRRLAERLADITRTLAEAAPAARDLPERTLREWRRTLEDLDQCEGEIDEVVKALGIFQEPENLRLLCWLVRKDANRRAVVRAIMERDGTLATDERVQSTLKAWAADIRATNQGRDFRVP